MEVNYTADQIAAIEKVQKVFGETMGKRDDIDLVYSKKAGYLLLFGINNDEGRLEMDPMFIKSAEDLFDFYLYEVACETFAQIGTLKDVHEANIAEKEYVMKAFEKYFEQAPEYRYLAELQFVSPEARRRSKK